MCVLFVAKNVSQKYPLIIVANRDEFYVRPTETMRQWSNSNIIAGRDLQAGGTWLGVSNDGKIAALTNIRDPKNQRDDAASRGNLVSDFLSQPQSLAQTKQRLIDSCGQYNGYNLLFGDINALTVFNSATQTFESITDGIHGLSNAELNTPWPKIILGRELLAHQLANNHSLTTDALAKLLTNNCLASDHDLPSTGVPKELEKALSPLFIQSSEYQYGTRCTSVIMLDTNNMITFYEASYNDQGLVCNTTQQQIHLT